MKKSIHVLMAFVFVLAFSIQVNAQVTANQYIFSTSTTGSIDSMVGSTVLLTAPNDDTPSPLVTFPGGFTFTYEGTAYTQFSLTPDGFLKLGSPVAVSQFTNAIVSTTNRPKLFPMWDDLALGGAGLGGQVRYLLTGGIFKIDWNVTIPRTTTGAANSRFQVWLYASGQIDFVYGVGGTPGSASVGINSVAANPTNFISVTVSTHTASTTVANNTNAAWPGDGRVYTFTPPPPPANDVGVTAINNPLPNTMNSIIDSCPPSKLAPKATVRNFGTAFASFSVTFQIFGASAYSSARSDTLSPGASRTLTFDSTFQVTTVGIDSIRVFTTWTSDSNFVNDTLRSVFRVVKAGFGGGLAANCNYFFANSALSGSCAPDQPIFDWVDTTGSSTLIANGVGDTSIYKRTGSLDDGFIKVGNILPAGTSFRYCGVDYDSFYVSTNGFIAFTKAFNTDAQFNTSSPATIPLLTAPRPAVFPFWKDLIFSDPDVPINRLSFKTTTTLTEGSVLVITYDRAANFGALTGSSDYVSFQCILQLFPTGGSTDGRIIFQYDDRFDRTGVDFLSKYFSLNLAAHTVGIQDATGTLGVLYRRASGTGFAALSAFGVLFASPVAVAFGPSNDPLPVELASFISTVNKRDVILNWTTATELNNSGFDVERSTVNGQWSIVGNVAGNGTTTSQMNYSFTDRNLASGKYNYRLKQIDFNGNFEYFNLGNEVGIGIPTKYDLAQNYPNPFNPTTKINYDIAFDGKVSIKIYDISGREVSTLVNDVQTAGYYTINFNGLNLSSGAYFYRISAEGNGQNFVATKKMMLVK